MGTTRRSPSGSTDPQHFPQGAGRHPTARPTGDVVVDVEEMTSTSFPCPWPKCHGSTTTVALQRGPTDLTAETAEFLYRETDLLDEARPGDEDTSRAWAVEVVLHALFGLGLGTFLQISYCT